ncbi:sulfatase [Antarctobacter sp.]|uniref:sulfatase family protein n=1 Tax=Antarctobacter sp. TaxID=1872577 RepID=UPI002B2655A9|nr:sulfatase-like hydrolase/transferase [Antarctobacter sp.]
MSRAPDILLITTDQQRGDCIGGAGRGVRTPNIQRIADRGARFDTCITPHPMCQAARASILTGKLPYSHGVRDNGRNLDPAIAAEGFGGVFARAGYDTRFIGKAHLSTHETFAATGTPECYISVADYPEDWTGPYMGFDRVGMMLRPHHHCGWKDKPYTLHYENFLDQDGQGGDRWARAKVPVPPLTHHKQVWRSALDDEWQSTSWIGDQAMEMLQEDRDAPLVAWVSFPDPHPPFLASAPWSTMYDPAEVDLPPHRALDLDRRPWWHRAFLESPTRRNQKRDHAGDQPYWGYEGALNDRDLRDVTAVYYGMIAAIDHQIGRILDHLETEGRLENTIVIFTSDHGEWLGDHGLLLKGPMLYDGLLRVPLVMAGPGIGQGRYDAPVSTLDLRATMAELAGLTVSDDDGTSLTDVMQDGTRDVAHNEWEVDAVRSGVDLDLRTVRSRTHRLSIDLKSGAGELYDLTADPHEMTNLWDEPSAAATRDRLTACIAENRPGMIPVAPRVGWH